MELLLRNGADTYSRNKDQKTPLHLAAQKGNETIVNALLKNGASRYAKDGDGKIPLDLAIAAGKIDFAVNHRSNTK